jgi:predicted  nucleic acid-binding Zn-ribbon protein|tara:strand:- start:268 stop:441 length:174 start_codon:yes stop_codon:yes gene_type:complete
MEVTEVDILKNNIKELQRQLQESYVRIKELREELDNEKDKFNRNNDNDVVGYYPGHS